MLQTLTNENQLLTSVGIFPLFSVRLLHVLEDQFCGWRIFPLLPHLTHPIGLSPKVDDAAGLLPMANEVVSGCDPNEAFASQQFAHCCSPYCLLLIRLLLSLF